MLGAARYRRYRDVVGAESGDAMVCILGAEAKLPMAVTTPRKNLSKVIRLL